MNKHKAAQAATDGAAGRFMNVFCSAVNSNSFPIPEAIYTVFEKMTVTSL